MLKTGLCRSKVKSRVGPYPVNLGCRFSQRGNSPRPVSCQSGRGVGGLNDLLDNFLLLEREIQLG